MNDILKAFPVWLAGIYLATGILDKAWNPLEWNGQQWAAGGCAMSILITLSGAYHWWKMRR